MPLIDLTTKEAELIELVRRKGQFVRVVPVRTPTGATAIAMLIDGYYFRSVHPGLSRIQSTREMARHFADLIGVPAGWPKEDE